MAPTTWKSGRAESVLAPAPNHPVGDKPLHDMAKKGIDDPVPERALRTGVYRSSFEGNHLLVHPPVGKPKPVHLPRHPGKEFTYGKVHHKSEYDRASEVMGHWQSHVPNPNTSLPGPDFRKMDKAATAEGILTAKEFGSFRKDHPATLRRGNSARQPDHVPSDKNPKFTYGRPSALRLEEEIRRTGPAVPIKKIIEGDYIEEWVRSKSGKDFGDCMPARMPVPRPTVASESRIRTTTTIMKPAGATAADTFKLSKFSGVPSRVMAEVHQQYSGLEEPSYLESTD